jgi:hypothetical protein
MGDTVSTLNSLMAEKFSPIVNRSFHNEQILLMMLEKVTADEINNRGGKYPVETLRQGSFQGGSESQSMPTAVNGEYKAWVPALKAVYSTGEFSGFTHLLTNILTVNSPANKLKIGGMLGEKIKSHTDQFGYFLDQTFFRDGKGKLADATAAVVTGALGTATVTPSTANWPVDEIPIGARVNFYNSSGTIHNTAAAVSTVTAVNPTTGVVTFDNVASNAVPGDFMVWEGSWDLFPNGLAGLVQNQNITFQSIDVTNYPKLKGNVYTASAALDIKFVNRLQTRARQTLGTKLPRNDYLVVTHPKEVDAYRNQGYALNTMIDNANRNSKTLDLAYSAVQISGMDIYESNGCGERQLYGLRLSQLKRFTAFEPGLLPLGDGESQYLLPVPGTNTYKHQYQYYFAFYGNVLNLQPAAHFLVDSLDKTNLG